MIPTPWTRFQWKTASLAASDVLHGPYAVRRALPDEEGAALKVALLSLTLDTGWHDASGVAAEFVQAGVKRSFANKEDVACLVIAHGQRIIGVSILDPHPEAVSHLLSGPAVLAEYRNRGLGTALLQASLQELNNRDLPSALGITRSNTTAARFVYPKFGGLSTDYLFATEALEQNANKARKAA